MEKIPQQLTEDLTTPEGRQKEIERVWQEEEKDDADKKEKIEQRFDLEKSRADYVKSYTEYRKEFSGVKKKESADIEEKIKDAQLFLKKEDFREGSKEHFIAWLKERNIGEKQAEAIYDAELKKAEYDAAKVQEGKKMKESGVPPAEIFQKLFLQERELLNQKKIESWLPKEKGIFRRGMEWYMKRGTATRLLISTGLVTTAVAGVGGFGAVAAATYAGYRFVRGFGSVMVGKLVGKGVDSILSRGIEAKKEAALEKLKSGFDLDKLKETEKELEKIFEENAKAERRKLLIKGAASVLAGAGTAIGVGMLENAWAGGTKLSPEVPPPKPGASVSPEGVKPVETITEIKPEVLPIGGRGPEGAIMDYFEKHPNVAVEKFGCPKELVQDGWIIKDIESFNKWAGMRAHQLWLEDAKEALAKPEILEQLKNLGYSEDAEGYAQMMHRVGKGTVELDIKSGQINLMDTEYLRPKVSHIIEGTPETKVSAPGVEVEPSNVKVGGIENLEKAGIDTSSMKDINIEEVRTARAFLIATEKLDFSSGEYDAIKNVKVMDLLREIPSEKGAWEIWRGEVDGKEINLPHHGIFGFKEFGRQIKLAEFIRKYIEDNNLTDAWKEETVEEFLKTVEYNQ